MTHDELCDYIDKFDAAAMVNEPAVKAVRAVVEMHKPEMRYDSKPFCSVCFTEGPPYEQAEDVYYPCPTIQAIKAAFND